MCINQLRDAGYKVRVHHLRKYRSISESLTRHQFEVQYQSSYAAWILPNGGSTVVELTTPDGVEVSGTAVCSEKDQYNRKLGLKIALGRAIAMEKSSNMGETVCVV
jgi:hypothetical protein